MVVGSEGMGLLLRLETAARFQPLQSPLRTPHHAAVQRCGVRMRQAPRARDAVFVAAMWATRVGLRLDERVAVSDALAFGYRFQACSDHAEPGEVT